MNPHTIAISDTPAPANVIVSYSENGGAHVWNCPITLVTRVYAQIPMAIPRTENAIPRGLAGKLDRIANPANEPSALKKKTGSICK